MKCRRQKMQTTEQMKERVETPREPGVSEDVEALGNKANYIADRLELLRTARLTYVLVGSSRPTLEEEPRSVGCKLSGDLRDIEAVLHRCTQQLDWILEDLRL